MIKDHNDTAFRAALSNKLSEFTKLQPNGCLEWQRQISVQGYGVAWISGYGAIRAHRAAWTAKYGAIPKGLCVCHQCDNPRCCNVDHLFLGTPTENNRDRDNKGRTRNGNKPGDPKRRAKFTDEQIVEIRNASGRYLDIAKAYGVTPTAIGLIKRRVNYPHVIGGAIQIRSKEDLSRFGKLGAAAKWKR